jgi:hypothetical protein
MLRTEGKAAAAALMILAVTGLAACSAPASARHVPAARMERVAPGKAPSVVLSPVGAQRLGLQAVTVRRIGSLAVIPYAALLYQPDGQTVVYTVTGSFTYTRQPVVVSKIEGNRVYLSRGPAPGRRVVTTGAEELLGVQDGVGVQT